MSFYIKKLMGNLEVILRISNNVRRKINNEIKSIISYRFILL